MVPGERIVEVALDEKPDIICLSGLITPSLGEMTEVVKLLSEAGIEVPVMVGGAATSMLHTSLKIDPAYKGMVLHMEDASQNPVAASLLLNPTTKEEFLKENKDRYESLRNKAFQKSEILPFKEILDIVDSQRRNDFQVSSPKVPIGESIKISVSLKEVIPLINWKMFFLAWKVQGSYIESFPFSGEKQSRGKWLKNIKPEEEDKAREALLLYDNAWDILKEMEVSDTFDGKCLIRFEKASGDNRNIEIAGIPFPMLRQQTKSSGFLSCSDYVGTKGYIGLFAVTAGQYLYNLSKSYEEEGDNYKSLLIQTLADRLAEASSEWLNKYVKEKYWDVSIRPAWGYPMLPDQTMILNTKVFLPYEEIGIKLTENGAMNPPSSISGLYFSKKDARYFMVGEIGEDQIKDYAERRGLEIEDVKSLLRQI